MVNIWFNGYNKGIIFINLIIMMYPGFGFGLGFGLLHLFCLSFFLGIVLFVVWAVKALDKKQLKKLVTWLLAVGLVGMIGSALLLSNSARFDKDDKGWNGMMNFEQMEKIMDVNEEVVSE